MVHDVSPCFMIECYDLCYKLKSPIPSLQVPDFSHVFSNPKPEVQNQIHWIAHAAKLHLSGEATNVPGKYFLEDWLSECVVEKKAKKCRCFMMFLL